MQPFACMVFSTLMLLQPSLDIIGTADVETPILFTLQYIDICRGKRKI